MAEGYRDVCEREKVYKYGSNPVNQRLYSRRWEKGAVEFYLDMNSTWKYHELVEHLRTLFESGETFELIGQRFL